MTEKTTAHEERERAAAARAGSAVDFQWLVGRHYGLVFAIAYARLGDADAAEDAAQETFLRAWLHLARLEDPARFAAWVARIARNLASDWAAQGGRGQGVAARLARAIPLHEAPESADPAEEGARAAMERDEETRWLRQAIQTLEPEQCEMVLLHYMEGLSKKEIARRLEVHPATVGRQLKAALAALKRQLEPLLRAAAPRLRPGGRETARAGAIIAAAAMLSAAGQAKLAAAAPVQVANMPLAGVAADAARGKVAATASGSSSFLGNIFLSVLDFLAGLLKPIATMGNTGGKTMGLGKIVLGLCTVIGIAAGSYQWKQAQPSGGKLDGVYLGGFDFFRTHYLVIGSDAQGNPRVERPEGEAEHCKIVASKDGYTLYWKFGPPWSEGAELLPDPQTGERKWYLAIDISPSLATPGDWDIKGELEAKTLRGFQGFYHALKLPLPSYLHRLDDRRMVGLIEAIQQVRLAEWGSGIKGEEWDTTWHEPRAPHDDLLRLAAQVASDHPDDPWVALLQMDTQLAARDLKGLAATVGRWQSRLEAPSFLRCAFRRAVLTLHALQLSAAGKNAYDWLAPIGDRQCDLTLALRKMLAINQFDGFQRPQAGVWPEMNFLVPNFLHFQVNAKVTQVAGMLCLLRGNRTDARDLGLASYRLGQMLNTEGTMIQKLIGIAIRAIACRALELYALNACETREELDAFWRALERLQQQEQWPTDPWAMVTYETAGNFLPEMMWLDRGIITPNLTEAMTRQGVANARFQLVRLATAARYGQVAQGKLPSSISEIKPLIQGTLPSDPFTSEPLRIAAMPGGIVGYSIGPDKTDDLGAITYDPTNGTLSHGDITMEIPAMRKYPFPRGGVRAGSKDELLRQFPNGLPADPFADTKGKPLGVSGTVPVYVYSYGPDGDEHVPGITHPQVAYDPTNGTSSAGDLFVELPGR